MAKLGSKQPVKFVCPATGKKVKSVHMHLRYCKHCKAAEKAGNLGKAPKSPKSLVRKPTPHTDAMVPVVPPLHQWVSELNSTERRLNAPKASRFYVLHDQDIVATDPVSAAREAWARIRAANSTANVFIVANVETGELSLVDLEVEDKKAVEELLTIEATK